jgi:tetratricopeptide (TPR) repeat protein
MNRFLTTLGSIVAVALSGCAGASGLQGASSSDLPQIAVKAYEQPSPESQLIYHILVGEMAVKRGQFDVALENYLIAARSSEDPRLLERTVGIALFVQNNAVALEVARRWLALDRNDVQARQALALALLRNAFVDEAGDHLEYVLKASRQDGQDGFATVSALLGQVNDKEVIYKVMGSLRKRHPQSVYALYYYAVAAVGVKEYQRALDGLNAALSRDPKWVPAHLLRARVMMDMGNTDLALKRLAAAVSAAPKDVKLRTGYARLLVSAARLQDAREQFQIIAKQNPKDADTLFALGVLALEARQFDDAMSYFMAVLRLGARVSEVYYELGKLEESRQDYRKARDWYARVTNNDEELYLSAQVKVGAMLARLGDFDRLKAHFAKVRQDNPQSEVPLCISEADILSKEGHYQAAYELLDQALAQKADDKDLLYSRALAAEKIDRLDLLERDLKLLIEVDPGNGQALNALGYTLADQTDRYEEALTYIQQALVLLPNDAAVLDSMGWVQYRLGSYPESLKYLRRAYELNPDAEIAAHLTEVLWVMGQQEEARKILRQAFEGDPENRYLLKVKERFGL